MTKQALLKTWILLRLNKATLGGRLCRRHLIEHLLNILNLHFLDWAPKNLSLATGHPAGAIHCHSVPYVAIQLPIKSLRDARTATIISSPVAPIVILFFYFLSKNQNQIKRGPWHSAHQLRLSVPYALPQDEAPTHPLPPSTASDAQNHHFLLLLLLHLFTSLIPNSLWSI